MKKPTVLYMRIDADLKAHLMQRATEENRSLANMVESILYRGMSTDQGTFIAKVEKAREHFEPSWRKLSESFKPQPRRTK